MAASLFPDDGRSYTAATLAIARGYVVDRETGEVLSSALADIRRERRTLIANDPRSQRGAVGRSSYQA